MNVFVLEDYKGINNGAFKVFLMEKLIMTENK
jgi:hypothetical protein